MAKAVGPRRSGRGHTELKGRVEAAVDLYWLPLGVRGHFVRFNGRVYEAIEALRDHRQPLDRYHTPPLR
jgi:hypothetical protein